MLYRKFNPSIALQPFVFCYYTLEHNEPIDYHLDVLSPPNGLAGMVWNFKEPYQVSDEKCLWNRVPYSFLAGQFTKSYQLRFKGKTGAVGIVFQPAGLAYILGIPATEYTDQRIDLNFVLGKEAVILEKKIMDCVNNIQRIAVLEKFLIKRVSRTENKPDVVDHAIELILHHKGLLSITQMSDELCISSRQLHRRFIEKIGVSPKLFSRIKRFNYISILSSNSTANWKDIVYEGGYYDQAHFIKDFCDFSGKNPSDYINYKKRLNRLMGT